MTDYGTVTKIVTPVLFIFLLVGGFYFYTTNQTKQAEIKQLKQELTKQKENEGEAREETNQLSKELENLRIEKNGTANDQLTNATNALFSTVFTYDTGVKEDSISKRKERAKVYANDQALNGLFPVDADQSSYSVSTVSKLKGDPELYVELSNDKEIRALVIVHYAVSIAGSDDQKGTFMYKVVFSSTEKIFTSINNLGQIDNL